MSKRQVTGPGAAVIKYDILTAISLIGLQGRQSLQRTVIRLLAAVTARYNWQRDELSIGHRDLSRLWAVSERTVIRELQKLQTVGILIRKRAGARNRVASYKLDIERVMDLSCDHWNTVGADFSARMTALTSVSSPEQEQREPHILKSKSTGETSNPTWAKVCDALRKEDEHLFNNWYSKLGYSSYSDRTLRLSAPNNFIADYISRNLSMTLLEAAAGELGPIRDVQITRMTT